MSHTHTNITQPFKRRKSWGLHYWSSDWKSALQCRRHRFNPWSGNWDPTSLRASKPMYRNWRVYSTQWGILHNTEKILCVATRIPCRQKKKKKKEILPFATTWMDSESIMLSKMSDRERQILYDLTYK